MKRPRGRYERFECDPKSFEGSIAIQKGNQSSFREHHLGARKKLIVYDKMIATTASTNRLELNGLPKGKFIAFLGRFQKQLYKRFRTIDKLYALDIQFKGVSRGKNTELWHNLPVGSKFYNIDCKSAYWQIGNKIGYIDYEMFKSYMHDDLYKSAKRYCFSFLARKNHMIYHTPFGVKEIQCDTKVLNKAYQNVRNQLYIEISNAKQGCKSIVEWNIDGVSVLADELDMVRNRFKEAGLEYKITECRKLSDFEYKYGSRTKNFKSIQATGEK